MNPLACLLCGLYVDVGAVALASIPPPPPPLTAWRYEITDTRNPYARIAVGYSHEFAPGWSARLELAHESSLTTRQDRGRNSAGAFITWRPFR